MLEIQSLSVSYNNHLALKGVTLTVKRGEVLALVGPNGAGKTTLIRAVSGVIPVRSGVVRAEGKNLQRLSSMQRASCLAVVPQARQLPESFTVAQTVSMGRTPYLGWLGQLNRIDQERIYWAMERTDTLQLSERRVDTLSGGEQQRALLARALAQDTPIMLMDEPTAHLDLRYQAGILELVCELAHEEKIAVLMALHDLNLVALYADRVALLVGGRLRSLGTPKEVLDPQRLAEAYGVSLQVIYHPERDIPLILPERRQAQKPTQAPLSIEEPRSEGA